MNTHNQDRSSSEKEESSTEQMTAGGSEAQASTQHEPMERARTTWWKNRQILIRLLSIVLIARLFYVAYLEWPDTLASDPAIIGGGSPKDFYWHQGVTRDGMLVSWKSSSDGSVGSCTDKELEKGYAGRNLAVKLGVGDLSSCCSVPLGKAYFVPQYIFVEVPWAESSFELRIPHGDYLFYTSRGGKLDKTILESTHLGNTLRHLLNIVISYIPFVCPEDSKLSTIDPDRIFLEFKAPLSHETQYVAWPAVKEAISAGENGYDDAIIGEVGSFKDYWIGISPRFLMNKL